VRKRKSASRRKIPGPKPSITLAVVKRVAARVGRGVPLEHALAAENKSTINKETWKKALAAHAEFSPLYAAGKGKFLDSATKRLAESSESADLKWLLERRHPDLFARPAEVSVEVNNSTTITGLNEDVLEQARIVARSQAKASHEKPS
jgi:hypothetical protein